MRGRNVVCLFAHLANSVAAFAPARWSVHHKRFIPQRVTTTSVAGAFLGSTLGGTSSSDVDTQIDSSALYLSASAASSSPADVVRWEDLLLAKQPIFCLLGDEECLKRQQQLPLEETLISDVHKTISAADVASIGLSVTAVGMALAWLISLSGPGAWRYYLSGGICAAASHVIPVPIDTVKTRKQIDPEFSRLHFLQAFQRILQQEGVSGLLAGLGPTAVGYLLEGAIKFGVYEVLKPVVSQTLSRIAVVSGFHLAFLNSKVTAFAISAAVSGVAASIMLCPMEALRIRMVANPQSKSGWLVTGCRMLKTEGVFSLSKGIVPMLFKQVPYTVTKNVSFDFMTRYAYAALQWRGSAIGPLLKLAVPFTAAAATSILSCVTSQPGDMLLSLVNAHTGDRRRMRDIVHDILRSDRGIAGFFVGMKTRFLHVGIIVTLQLLIYDVVKRLCGIAATGMAS